MSIFFPPQQSQRVADHDQVRHAHGRGAENRADDAAGRQRHTERVAAFNQRFFRESCKPVKSDGGEWQTSGNPS